MKIRECFAHFNGCLEGKVPDFLIIGDEKKFECNHCILCELWWGEFFRSLEKTVKCCISKMEKLLPSELIGFVIFMRHNTWFDRQTLLTLKIWVWGMHSDVEITARNIIMYSEIVALNLLLLFGNSSYILLRILDISRNCHFWSFGFETLYVFILSLEGITCQYCWLYVDKITMYSLRGKKQTFFVHF